MILQDKHKNDMIGKDLQQRYQFHFSSLLWKRKHLTPGIILFSVLFFFFFWGGENLFICFFIFHDTYLFAYTTIVPVVSMSSLKSLSQL